MKEQYFLTRGEGGLRGTGMTVLTRKYMTTAFAGLATPNNPNVV